MQEKLLPKLFLGKTGNVLKVTAKKRIGSEGSIVTCMRKALDAGFTVPVGMGGTFLQSAGIVKYHIMPDFRHRIATAIFHLTTIFLLPNIT